MHVMSKLIYLILFQLNTTKNLCIVSEEKSLSLILKNQKILFYYHVWFNIYQTSKHLLEDWKKLAES